MYEDRLLVSELFSKVMTPERAAELIKLGMIIGCSGFTTAGFPKAIPQAIAKTGTANNLTLITPASTGNELDGALANAGLIAKRYSFQSNETLRNAINRGEVEFMDLHLSQVPEYIQNGCLGNMDYAIIECCMVQEDCGIVPMASLGATDILVKQADRIILEINTSCPKNLHGIHDICDVSPESIIPIRRPEDRIGSTTIACSPDKIAAIVFTDQIGSTPSFKEPDEISRAIADNIICFLKSKIAQGELPPCLSPLQSGVGAVGNAVFTGYQSGSSN